MLSNKKSKKNSDKNIVSDILSGNAHFRAWSEVVKALDEADPQWGDDDKKTPVENAVTWIKARSIEFLKDKSD